MNAIRAMIMYYRESNDETILPVIRRIKNGMMLPVGQGGTVAIERITDSIFRNRLYHAIGCGNARIRLERSYRVEPLDNDL